jgi:hypothetical protein
MSRETKKGRTMPQLIYAMRFTGHAEPVGTAGNVLKAATTAPSTALTSIIGAGGLAGDIRLVDGGEAVFTSEVTFTGETSFQEVGMIAFGDGHRVWFGTVGSGYLGASADPARKHGTVMWQVEGGEGQFAGVSGLITSDFIVGDDLAITDHHFGVLFLP